jgi:hypothetical protein
MAPTPMTLSGKTYTAAKPWASLPQSVLDRTCFFHHTTLTNSHANEGKVLKLMGAVKRQEMLISLLAKNLAPCLSTVQVEPASISGEVITFGGRILPALTPVGLRDVFVSPKGPLTNLQALRDADLDRVQPSAQAERQHRPAQLPGPHGDVEERAAQHLGQPAQRTWPPSGRTT